ncbi:MFS transporter [Citrobacter telavivensis]
MDNTEKIDQRAWHYVNLIFLMQIVGASSSPIIISLGGMVGARLSSTPSLATLPVSLYSIGMALATLPVGYLIARFGRQSTYLMGALIAAIGGLFAAYGVYSASFLNFCIGAVLAGGYGACVQNYRFAAIDYLPGWAHPKAISRVMQGGLVAAVLGPQLVILGQDILDVPLVGSFLSQSVLALIAIILILSVGRLTTGLVVPEEDKITEQSERQENNVPRQPRTILQIIKSFRFIVAVTAGLTSYGLMMFMMTVTSMAIVDAGHSINHATLGVQWHILAMYLPSFFTGKLMTRYGKLPVTILGFLIIALSSVCYFIGNSVFIFWSGFALLGLGWNFSFIGATALVTECYHASERSKVQSLNDLLVFGASAIASLISGQLYHSLGWINLNWLTFIPIALAVLLLLRLSKKGLAGQD